MKNKSTLIIALLLLFSIASVGSAACNTCKTCTTTCKNCTQCENVTINGLDVNTATSGKLYFTADITGDVKAIQFITCDSKGKKVCSCQVSQANIKAGKYTCVCYVPKGNATYTVKMCVTGADKCCVNYNKTVTIGTTAQSCTPSFTWTKKSCCSARCTVQFTDTSTGNPTSWKWDINSDGKVDSYSKNPRFSMKKGTYKACLKVYGCGSWKSVCKTITI